MTADHSSLPHIISSYMSVLSPSSEHERKHLEKNIHVERQSPVLKKGEVELRKETSFILQNSSVPSEENNIIYSYIRVRSDDITLTEKSDLGVTFNSISGSSHDQTAIKPKADFKQKGIINDPDPDAPHATDDSSDDDDDEDINVVKASIDESSKSDYGSSSHFTTEEEHHMTSEWNSLWRNASSDISCNVAHQHVVTAHNDITILM